MKSKRIILRIALACASGWLSLPVAADTLRDAVDQAIRTNPELLASTSRRLAADQGVKQAQAGYLPRLDLNLAKGREWLDSADTRLLGLNDTVMTRREATVTLTQMLFDGFAVRSEVARQTARVESSAYNVAATAEDLALRTVTVYLEVLRRQETVLEALENLEAHERIYRQITTLAEGGVGRRADINQAESRLALAKANLRQEQSSLKDAEVSYARLVGTPARALQVPAVPDKGLPANEVQLLDLAAHGHPAVKAAEADVAAASALNAGAKAALSPRLDLELSSSRSNDIVRGETNDRAIMLRLRYNLSRGGADIARISETGFQAQEASEVLNRVRAQVQENAALAYNASLSAHDRVDMLRQYVGASAATREAYLKQFSIGQRSLLDLLNAENEYFSARQAYTTGQYAQLAGAFRIFASIGELLTHLEIGVPKDSARIEGQWRSR